MKRTTILQISLFAVAFLLFTGNAFTSSSGINSAMSGSPMSNNNTCSQCHGGASASTQNVTISTDIPASGYQENTDYTITVDCRGNGGTAIKGGFNATVENANGFAGTLSTLAGGGAAVSGNSATHRSISNTFSGDSLVWRFKWNSGTSPNATVYVAANFANGNGTTSGDAIVTESLSLTKSSIGTQEFALNEFSLYPNPAQEQINLGFSAINGGSLTITVYDLVGRHIKTLYDATVPAGAWREQFNVSGLSPGTYIVLVRLNEDVSKQKLIIE